MATHDAARSTSRGMTHTELLALPAAIGLDTANRALALGRSKGYDLAKRGHYPCKVLRFGNAYRVITADLLRVLGLGDAPLRRETEPDRAQEDGHRCA